jgi:transposase
VRKQPKQHRGPVLDVLRELLSEGRNDAVLELVQKLVAHNEELTRRLAELSQRRKKGEGVSSAQLSLLLDDLKPEQDKTLDEANKALEDAAAPNEDKAPKTEKPPKQPRTRQAPPKNLRRVDNPINVAQKERPCPICGKERTCIGHDVSEVVELIPAELIVRVDRREKLACTSCEGELVRAPLGDKVVPGGMFGPMFVANVLVDKYRDGLPLHRQKQRFETLGMTIPISTLVDQVTWVTELLRPLWRALLVMVINSGIMQLDGTGIAVRDKDYPQNNKVGTLWGYIGDNLALYLYTSTGKKTGQQKGEIGPEDVLKAREGYTVADAANLFDKSFQRQELIECGCNMHARRYFKKALDSGDHRAALPLSAFKKLYDIEEGVRGRPPDEVLAVRKEHSVSIYDTLVDWCKAHQPVEPPKSPMGKAIGYLLNHEQALRRFMEHGAIPMDNGAVERLHIRVALTRKNFLFAGSDAGAQRAAIAYSILGCCALAELVYALPRLARGIRLRDAPELLPHAWKATRENA